MTLAQIDWQAYYEGLNGYRWDCGYKDGTPEWRAYNDGYAFGKADREAKIRRQIADINKQDSPLP